MLGFTINRDATKLQESFSEETQLPAGNNTGVPLVVSAQDVQAGGGHLIIELF
jgi:hypothetical protein